MKKILDKIKKSLKESEITFTNAQADLVFDAFDFGVAQAKEDELEKKKKQVEWLKQEIKRYPGESILHKKFCKLMRKGDERSFDEYLVDEAFPELKTKKKGIIITKITEITEENLDEI